MEQLGFTGNGDRKVSYHCIHWQDLIRPIIARLAGLCLVGNERGRQLKLSTCCSGPFLKNYDRKLERLLTERRGNGN